MPKRIQLRRTKGWRMPRGAVKVDRSTKWGNPFHQREHGGREAAVAAYRDWVFGASEEAAALRAAARRELRGVDLACWCPLDGPCHGDVLLEVANAPRQPFDTD